MYKVRRYYNLDEKVLEKEINSFCIDNKCELITMSTPKEYYIDVVYKEINDETEN